MYINSMQKFKIPYPASQVKSIKTPFFELNKSVTLCSRMVYGLKKYITYFTTYIYSHVHIFYKI